VEHAVRQRVPSTHPDHRLTANTKPPPRRKTQWDNPTPRSGTQPRSHPRCCHTTKLTTETTVDRWIQVKNDKVYTELRKQGDSKEKAARIATASAARGSSSVGRKGGKSGSYDDWAVPELKKRAKQLGISGYSGKRKSELVSALRNH